MNKKGLATGIIAITLLIFVFATSGIISLKLWNETNDVIQNLDNNTVSQDVKNKIDDLTDKMEWGDKLFVLFFVLLIAAFIISSATLPVDQPIFLIIFIFILLITCIIAMFLSNAWTYMLDQSIFTTEATKYQLTDYILRFLPIITFFTGIIGALIFYGRGLQTNTGRTDGFE